MEQDWNDIAYRVLGAVAHSMKSEREKETLFLLREK